ncbi:MAG: hypothetical protein MPEBLZ_04306 [Candidatus Methanoperedens nitroreducens]|uniref:EVE domain protein n=1 Tax=Candidatus Methanoperedens nitratireducens TaxID=1392998 RepID=A0A0P7ZZU3_9EURY|nr:MAG: hypothetical protein MPEBLZ_04306 [Candidatus Methanoperedens sp. BLZ1]MCX9086531.1 hypothetical protein [Candidatus Methanoperedens sp.]CAG0977269.1 hypothetical protein METP2_01748 [Methanosarcinales archaeon]
MVRTRKNKARIVKDEPTEEAWAVWLTINDTDHDVYDGKKWIDEFKANGETIYDAHFITKAYSGMPVYIYLTSKKSLVADAEVSSDIDMETEKRTPLINLTVWGEDDDDESNNIHKDELTGLGIIKRVPITFKFLSKDDYETIEKLFED